MYNLCVMWWYVSKNCNRNCLWLWCDFWSRRWVLSCIAACECCVWWQTQWACEYWRVNASLWTTAWWFVGSAWWFRCLFQWQARLVRRGRAPHGDYGRVRAEADAGLSRVGRVHAGRVDTRRDSSDHPSVRWPVQSFVWLREWRSTSGCWVRHFLIQLWWLMRTGWSQHRCCVYRVCRWPELLVSLWNREVRLL